MKTLPDAITAGKGGDSQRVYLVRIIPEAGDSWSELLWATKDITVTAWEGGVTSKVFVGNMLAKDGIGTISQSIDIEEGGNVAKVSGLTLTVLNPQYSGETRFDTSFANYNLENRTVEIRLVFYTGSNPAWADTLRLPGGVVEDVEYGYGEYKIKIRDAGLKRHKNIPDLILTTDDYPNLPDYNKNKIPPLIFGFLGNDTTPWLNLYETLLPMIRIDKTKYNYIVSQNKAHDFQDAYVFCYFSEVNRCARVYQDVAFTISKGRPSTLQFALGQKIKADFYSQAEGQGEKTNPTSLDFANAVDDTDTTYFTLGASQKLYLRIPIPSEFASIQDEANNIKLLITTGTITGTGKARYWNPEWDAGLGKFSDGQSFNVADQNLIITYPIGGDKTAHGKEDDQSDQNNGWAFDELATYEFGLECDASSSIQIKNIYLWIHGMLFKAVIIHKEGKAPKRRGTGKRDWPKEVIDFIQDGDNLFAYDGDGAEFGAWIDQDSRNNGYNSGDLIDYGAYIIESILRDELGLTSTEINYADFDTLGNTTNGHRKNWRMAGIISDQKNSLEHITNFCRECACIYFQNYENKETVKVLKKLTAVKTIDRTTIQEGTPKTSFSALNKVYNEFYLSYRKQYTHGDFVKTLFVTASDHNLSSNTRGGTPNTYTGLCADSQTKYNFTQRLTLDCDWIRNDATAEYLIKWLMEWLCYRKYIMPFKTDGLDHIDLELGDQVKIDHTLLPTGVSNDDSFILFDVKHDPREDKIDFKFMQVPDLLP